MEKITDMELESVSSSKWLQPWRLKYKQDGVAKDWDMLKSNGSVVSVVYNESSDSLVMVKQFRPAVLVCKALRDSQSSSHLSGITLNHLKSRNSPRISLDTASNISFRLMCSTIVSG